MDCYANQDLPKTLRLSDQSLLFDSVMRLVHICLPQNVWRYVIKHCSDSSMFTDCEAFVLDKSAVLSHLNETYIYIVFFCFRQNKYDRHTGFLKVFKDKATKYLDFKILYLFLKRYK